MVTTVLSNLIEPKVFTAYATQQTAVKSALISSGVLFTSNEISAQASAPGAVFEAPQFNPFQWTESNVMSDDPSATSTPANIVAGSQIGQKDYREKDWGAMALTSAIVGANVMDAISNIVSTYWVQDYQQLVLAKLKGIELDNAANDGGDMIKNIAVDTTTISATNTASFGAFLDAIQTMGDAMDKVGVIVMHSQVFTNLMKLEATAFVPPSTNEPFVKYYNKRVIIDDTCPVVQGTNQKTYTTYLLGQGAFAYGEGSFDHSTEVWRNPAAGNGSGEERLYSRKQLVLHPLGFSSTATITARSKSATLAQYGALGAFDRKFDRKNVAIAILKTNG